LCRVEAGYTLRLVVRRAGMPVKLSIVAETRPWL
jgi:hypothetical protein